MEKRTPLSTARNILLKLWLIGSAPTIVTLVVITLLGRRFNGIEDQVWGWISPLIFPSISMMLGVIGSAAFLSHDPQEKTVNSFFLNVSIWLSAVFLFLVFLIILLQPLSQEPSIIKFFSKTNLFIAPVQSLVTAAFGFLFSSTSNQKSQVDIPSASSQPSKIANV